MSVSADFEQSNTRQNKEHPIIKEAHTALCRQAGVSHSFMQVCKGPFQLVNLNCTVRARFSFGGASRWGLRCLSGLQNGTSTSLLGGRIQHLHRKLPRFTLGSTGRCVSSGRTGPKL